MFQSCNSIWHEISFIPNSFSQKILTKSLIILKYAIKKNLKPVQYTISQIMEVIKEKEAEETLNLGKIILRLCTQKTMMII